MTVQVDINFFLTMLNCTFQKYLSGYFNIAKHNQLLTTIYSKSLIKHFSWVVFKTLLSFDFNKVGTLLIVTFTFRNLLCIEDTLGVFRQVLVSTRCIRGYIADISLNL